MPHYESYIAPLKSPGFFWDDIPDERFRRGNTPKVRLAPSTWTRNLGYAPQFILDCIESGEYEGQQVDWGAWAMIVSKADCIRLWQQNKPESEVRQQAWLATMADIDALDDSEMYVLVVAELP